MPERNLGLGILASGSGTNLQAIIDACESGRIDANVRIVISDDPKASALERAKKHAIPHQVVQRKDFKKKSEFETKIVDLLRSRDVELVCLAGFMRIIGNSLLDAFPLRILNIHPALLPAFPGLDGQKQALDYGVKVAGCTVHFVDDQIDHGPIICQETVPVLENDTLEDLKARILEKEHMAYPRSIQLYAEDRLKIEKRRVYISPQKVVGDD